MKIHVDMDGVVADFDGHYLRLFGVKPTRWPDPDNVDWDRVRSRQNFFRTIPLMHDAEVLLRGVIATDLPWGMLTGVPKSVNEASNEKHDWIKAASQKMRMPAPSVICCPARDKYKHGKPGDILIDDYLKYKDRWVAMGGIFVHHTSAESSLHKLHDALTKGVTA